MPAAGEVLKDGVDGGLHVLVRGHEHVVALLARGVERPGGLLGRLPRGFQLRLLLPLPRLTRGARAPATSGQPLKVLDSMCFAAIH